MGRSFLAGAGFGLALILSKAAWAQSAPAPASGAGEPAPIVLEPEQDPAVSAQPEGAVITTPSVEVVHAPVAAEPLESASQRDPSGALTVIHTSDFGGAAKDAAEVLSTSTGVQVQDS